jgi:hypothetical protein
MTEEKDAILKGDEKNVFFYIPDISGFTEFIQHTNLKQGAEIIHDLLEVIIDSNILNLKIAEIQGDSIWFYRFGYPVTLAELEKQTVKTFTDFLYALSELEEKYAVPEGLKNLTLKIVVHYGNVSTTVVKGTLKIIGPDTVIAHRLMKNNIPGHEYLLMTEQYLETQSDSKGPLKNFRWDKLRAGSCYYEHLGNIEYRFVSLTSLRHKIHQAFR